MCRCCVWDSHFFGDGVLALLKRVHFIECTTLVTFTMALVISGFGGG